MIDGNFGINVGQEFQHGPSIFPGGAFPTQQWQNDLNYLWSLGIRNVRHASNSINFLPAVALQQQAIQMSVARGMNVLWMGIGYSGSSPDQWLAQMANQLSYAQWAQANGVACFGIGNELEGATVEAQNASISRSGSLITVVTSVVHGMVTGDSIIFRITQSGSSSGTIFGIPQGDFYIITVVDSFTFTFTTTRTGSNGSFTSPNAGWSQWSTSTIRNFMKRTSDYLKANSITIPLSYSCVQNVESAQTPPIYHLTAFVNQGRGSIDFIDLNKYGDSGFPHADGMEPYFQDFKNEVLTGYNGFGPSHFRVTEWNIWNLDTGQGWSSDNKINVKYMMKRLQFMQALGIKHYHFCWRFADNLLPVINDTSYNIYSIGGSYKEAKVTDPVFNDWWWPMIGKRAPTVTIGVPFNNLNINTGFIAGNNIVPISKARTTPAQVKWSGLGMNYGQSEQSGTYDAAKATAAFTYLKNAGVKKIRIGQGDPGYPPALNATRNAALLAKSMGLYVCFVNVGGGLNDANWSIYTANANATADWAYANGIDEYQPGNEIDGEYNWSAPGALTNSVAKQLAMANDIKANHFPGTLSIAIAQDRQEATWISMGKGSYDLLGYNCYGDQTNSNTDFQSKVTTMFTAFGNGMYLSEMNINFDWTQYPQPETFQTTLIGQRIAFLQSLGLNTAYFFTYSWLQSNDQFALFKSDGTFRNWWSAMFQPTPRTRTIGRGRVSGRTKTP